MRMGQGVRTGLGHRGITCVLQTQFSSFFFFFDFAEMEDPLCNAALQNVNSGSVLVFDKVFAFTCPKW